MPLRLWPSPGASVARLLGGSGEVGEGQILALRERRRHGLQEEEGTENERRKEGEKEKRIGKKREEGDQRTKGGETFQAG